MVGSCHMTPNYYLLVRQGSVSAN